MNKKATILNIFCHYYNINYNFFNFAIFNNHKILFTMKKNSLLLSLLVLSILFSINTNAQGYKIKVKINNLKNQDLILGHHYNDNLIPDDTVRTDKNGVAVFKGKEKLVGGMYFIFLPSARYFDFLIGDNQEFYIENDTTDLIKNLIFKNSPNNKIFQAYHNFLTEQNKKLSDLQQKKKTEKDANEKKNIQKQIDETIVGYNEYYTKTTTENTGLFVIEFIKATREVEVPPEIKDREAKYYYYRNHYFDNFDVGNPRLLFTPLYERKIDTYLEKILIQHPDTLITEIDIMLEKTRHDDGLFKYMLIHLFNKYAKSKLMTAENVYVHLGYIYINEATWSTDSFKTQLKPKLDRKSNCLVGNKAKPLSMQSLYTDSISIEDLRPFLQNMKEQGLKLENDTTRTFNEILPELSEQIAQFMSNFNGYVELYDIKTKYTILWFFEPDCSHCKHDTPLLYKEYIDNLQKLDVTVMSIYMERNTDDWSKFSNHIGTWFNFVEKNKMYNWYNVWNPFDNYRYKYDLSSSPVLYLLDKDKTILAKRIGYKQAIEMIQAVEKE